jgi:hypothetical protein
VLRFTDMPEIPLPWSFGVERVMHSVIPVFGIRINKVGPIVTEPARGNETSTAAASSMLSFNVTRHFRHWLLL